MTAADGPGGDAGWASSGKELVAGAPSATTLLSGAPVGKPAAAPLATQTAAIGIITPPPEIRSIVVRRRRHERRRAPRGEPSAPLHRVLMRLRLVCVVASLLQDKTAQFVARNGPEFEKRCAGLRLFPRAPGSGTLDASRAHFLAPCVPPASWRTSGTM